MREVDEGDPIYEAIDRGGGQTCDINGVIRALDAAGYVIVPRKATEEMCAAGAKYYHDNWRPGHAVEDTSMPLIWDEMVSAAVGEG